VSTHYWALVADKAVVMAVQLFTLYRVEDFFYQVFFFKLWNITATHPILFLREKFKDKIKGFLNFLRKKRITYVDRYGEWKIGKVSGIMKSQNVKRIR